MRNKTRVIISLFAVLFFGNVVAIKNSYGQSPTNGIHNGYVGSDKWFAEMRRSAANQAMIKALSGTTDHKRLPADYIEMAGLIVFPGGNPFPKGNLPDLRIQCQNQKADRVERAPFVDKEGAFYTVLKKDQTYELFWMYYFGSREKFASIYIDPKGPPQRKLVIEYNMNGAKISVVDNKDEKHPIPTQKEKYVPPADVDQFDLSGFPPQPTNFEEQSVMETIKSATTSALKAKAHEKLAKYYEKKGALTKAKLEYAKARHWKKEGEKENLNKVTR